MTTTRVEHFPRSTDLPSQSPLFWVEQKDRYLRQLLIRDIEESTGRRLIAYFANRFEQVEIDARDPLYMTELLGDVGANEPVDILVETPGGETDATEALVSAIQNRISDFRAVVGKAAKSNGTLLCLAARSIVMGAPSELGPIEPMVAGIPCSILTEPKIADQNFPLHMAGQFALQQSRAMAKRLLVAGMMSGRTSKEVDDTVRKLSSRDVYFSHGTAITPPATIEKRPHSASQSNTYRPAIRCGSGYGFSIACMIMTVASRVCSRSSRAACAALRLQYR